MPSAEPVHFTIDGRVARVTLDRPPLHILDLPTLAAFDVLLDRVNATPEAVVVVIGATGDKAFSSGVNIADHTPEKVAEMLERFHAAIRKLRSLNCVTIAAVKGMALGGGFELALACDMIVAEEGANFGVPEIWLGCFPPIAAAVLPRLMAPQKATELILSGEPITAREAASYGLVNLVAKQGGLDAALDRYVTLFTEKSAAALRIAKRAIRIGETEPFGKALSAIERLYLDDLMQSEDAKEGIRAYLEKREPKWKDR